VGRAEQRSRRTQAATPDPWAVVARKEAVALPALAARMAAVELRVPVVLLAAVARVEKAGRMAAAAVLARAEARQTEDPRAAVEMLPVVEVAASQGRVEMVPEVARPVAARAATVVHLEQADLLQAEATTPAAVLAPLAANRNMVRASCGCCC